MTEINFQPMFDYFDHVLDKKLSEQKQDILSEIRNEFNGRFDGISKQLLDLTQEMHVNNHRIYRLENWADVVGLKTKIPFET